MNDIDDVMIGKAIKKVREERGLKQKEINDKMGMGRTWLSDIERGKQGIGFNEVIKLCELMDVDIDDLTSYILNHK